MAYIGVQPRLGNFQACDAITTSSTATFNLLVGGTAIFPQTAQHCLVSLNGVLQAPISSYTISGSTIVFASALTSADSIDFITILGDTLDLGTPSDGTVATASVAANAITGAKLNTDTISAQTALTAEPADTDEFLVSDAGVLKRIDYSLIKATGITEADQWRVTTNVNANTSGDIDANWERNDSTGATYIGTGLTESSGIFTFPSTGKYLINFQMALDVHGGDVNAEVLLKVTTNNSSYATAAFGLTGQSGSTDGVRQTVTNSHIFDVTNTTNCKFKFSTDGFSTSTRVVGDSGTQISGFHIIRLGDT